MLMDRKIERAGTATIAACAAGAAIVLLCALAPADLLTVKSPSLGVASETAAGLGALVAYWMAMLRAERTRAWGDQAVALAIGIITIGSMLVAVLTLVSGVASSSIATWAPVPGRIGAVALLIAAALLRRDATPDPLRRLAFLAGTTSIALLLAGMGVALGALGAGSRIPLSLQLLIAAGFFAAAIALAGRARQTGDASLAWYAAFASAMAVARITGVLAPDPGDSWVAVGDLVRLGGVALLLMAGWSQSREAGERMVQSTLELERRRLAREIHDGLAQELAFIVSQSRRLARRAPQGGPLDLLLRASETALLDARRTMFSLKTSSPRALSTAVAQRAFVIAERAGIALDVEVLDEVCVSPEVEHAILRIINEAVTNAARHGAATSVSIRVSTEGERAVVRIADDGRGFDPRLRRRRSAFGLASMTDRARSLGGRLRLESEPGQGTVIEVAF
jgi:signal transduction histidine kinase